MTFYLPPHKVLRTDRPHADQRACSRNGWRTDHNFLRLIIAVLALLVMLTTTIAFAQEET